MKDPGNAEKRGCDHPYAEDWRGICRPCLATLLTEAEDRGLERAAGIVERACICRRADGDHNFDCPGYYARAIRAAKGGG